LNSACNTGSDTYIVEQTSLNELAMNRRTPPKPVPPSAGERAWRNVLFYLSVLMGALALVDFDAGRIAHGLGDAGVACLLLSLEAQFPFVRALVAAGGQKQDPGELLRTVERHRQEHPWSHRIGACGWALLAASLVLRISGVN
jgi:hypothetical protein